MTEFRIPFNPASLRFLVVATATATKAVAASISFYACLLNFNNFHSVVIFVFFLPVCWKFGYSITYSVMVFLHPPSSITRQLFPCGMGK